MKVMIWNCSQRCTSVEVPEADLRQSPELDLCQHISRMILSMNLYILLTLASLILRALLKSFVNKVYLLTESLLHSTSFEQNPIVE